MKHHLRQLLAAVALSSLTLPVMATSSPAPAPTASTQPHQTTEQWLATLKPSGNATRAPTTPGNASARVTISCGVA